MPPTSRAARRILPLALLSAVLAVPTAAAAQPSVAPQGSRLAQPTPVPVTGHSDLGDWASGVPVVTSGGSALASPGATSSAETTTADLTSSIATKLATRAKDTRLGSAWSGQVVDFGTGKA